MGGGHTLGESRRNRQRDDQPCRACRPTSIRLTGSSTAVTATAAAQTPAVTKYMAPGIAALQGGQTAPVSMYGTPNNLVAMNAGVSATSAAASRTTI